MASQHRYYVAGKRVPAVSTILGQLGWGKEGLIQWAHKIGAAGQDLEEARRGPADAGTIAHAAIEGDITGQTIDLSRVEETMLGTVESIVARWREWKIRVVDELLLSETELTSSTMLYGGRLDMLFRGRDGRTWLLDVKTGALYSQALVQASAYAMLVEENTKHRVDVLAILRIPRDSDSITTLERPFDREGMEVETFRLCRRLYTIQRQLDAEV
jgi:hypothetical protein